MRGVAIFYVDLATFEDDQPPWEGGQHDQY
jgi:hypothetical protein